MFLVSVFPYIVPFLAMIYPIAVTFGALRNAPKDPEEAAYDPEGELRKDELRNGRKIELVKSAKNLNYLNYVNFSSWF